MKELLTALVDAYEKAGLACAEELWSAATQEELNRLSIYLGSPIPDELRGLYLVYGGQEYFDVGNAGLFGRHRLLSPDDVIEKHRMLLECCLLDRVAPNASAEVRAGYWRPQLIPFASWDSHDLCVDVVSGEVWEFNPHWGLSNHREGIRAVLEELLTAVRNGAEPVLSR